MGGASLCGVAWWSNTDLALCLALPRSAASGPSAVLHTHLQRGACTMAVVPLAALAPAAHTGAPLSVTELPNLLSRRSPPPLLSAGASMARMPPPPGGGQGGGQGGKGRLLVLECQPFQQLRRAGAGAVGGGAAGRHGRVYRLLSVQGAAAAVWVARKAQQGRYAQAMAVCKE